MFEPFEIDEGAAMGARSQAESGAVNWAQNEEIPTIFNTSIPETFAGMKLIARLEQQKPESVALHVRFSASGSPVEFSGCAQVESLNANGPGYVLVIDYGDLTGRHRIAADLRSGTYQLPAITFAQVYALQWHPLGTSPFEILVAATLSRSVVPQPKSLTFTGYGELAAGATAVVPIPYYAQASDVWATGWVGGIGAANAPIINAEDLGIYRDYTTGLSVPPWGPVSYSGDGVSNDSVTIENAGPAEVRVFVQFYLEP